MKLHFLWSTTAASVGLLAAASALPAACALPVSGLGETAGGGGSSTVAASSSSAQSGSSASSSGTSSGTSSSSASSSANSSSSSSSSSSGGPPVCGNSVKESGEECDDGNNAPFDRCDPMCVTEHPEKCPGTPISLAFGQVLVIKDSTSGATNKFTDTPNLGSCQNNNWAGPDLIYAVTPTTGGTLKATLNATYGAPLVHIRTKCPGAKGDEIACDFAAFPVPTVSVGVTAGMTYYVAADSWGGNSGGFTLTLSLQ